jgi:soluble lytic murein transglycosylase-like protein
LNVCAGDSFVRPFSRETGPEPAERAELPDAYAPWAERVRLFGMHGLEEGEWEAVSLAKAGDEPPKGAYQALADAGMPSLALWLVGLRGNDVEKNVYAPQWRRVQFPRAYWEHVRRMADATGLDPYLLLAVGRQESFFRSDAVSSAGATGVMQLMPGTAKWLGSVEPAVERSHVEHLTHPAHSLRLGAYYLMRMVRSADGNLIFALASYNAGPGNVAKWRRRWPNASPETFLESIPFGETRHFVKRVLGNYGAYYSLYFGVAGSATGNEAG